MNERKYITVSGVFAPPSIGVIDKFGSGSIVALFYDKEDAQEYADFKNGQLLPPDTGEVARGESLTTPVNVSAKAARELSQEEKNDVVAAFKKSEEGENPKGTLTVGGIPVVTGDIIPFCQYCLQPIAAGTYHSVQGEEGETRHCKEIAIPEPESGENHPKGIPAMTPEEIKEYRSKEGSTFEWPLEEY